MNAADGATPTPPDAGSPLRIALVDDQTLVRDGFARVVRAQTDMELVGLGANGRDAVDLARDATPDVMVVDIRMPVLDGIAATREILAAPRHDGAAPPRILVVTTFNLDEYVFDALRAGASGFLLKDASPPQLLDAVRTIARGEALVDPAVTRTLIGSFAGRIRPPVTVADESGQLTPRELEVLRLLARGMSNVEIAEAMFVTRETAKTYVSRILLKLGVRDRVQAVVYAYRTGIADD
ncbi:response regulator transcription factor [Curtobacterium sp. PhB136]|uniref:response regulator n=1 Tax=Curtobacterium sp. PhB136 TaxID=2485181 RepID=UPI0010452D46|nr:response regulator transcription factor [Curtobacterium sp. PhB136]TCK59277.1 LuxR family two component transcriptional regulator [Curtobacterium sp. PhB136]